MQPARQIDKDKAAVWIVNLSQFRMPHGTREGVYFEPAQPTGILLDDWIKGQKPILVEVDDPFGDLPASPVIDPNPLVNSANGKPVTGVGTGPEGSGNADDMRKAAEQKAADELAAAKAVETKAKK